MQFGIQFFPDVTPEQKAAQHYFDDALNLVGLCDTYGYSHVRIVEHYFHPWGGYLPNPIVFLAAASQRTKTARMITGVDIPVFNHPLKLAAEIGMLDSITGGRLDVGFARAFLPLSIAISASAWTRAWPALRKEKSRSDVLENNVATSQGHFDSFEDVTSLPRPTRDRDRRFISQRSGRLESFERAGQLGHGLMAIPGVGIIQRSLSRSIGRLERRRTCGPRKHMMAVFMFCHDSQSEAKRIAKGPIERHFASIYDAMSEHVRMAQSADYKGYDKMAEKVRRRPSKPRFA